MMMTSSSSPIFLEMYRDNEEFRLHHDDNNNYVMIMVDESIVTVMHGDIKIRFFMVFFFNLYLRL